MAFDITSYILGKKSGGGGGGSSDFTTATVTITNSYSYDVDVQTPYIFENSQIAMMHFLIAAESGATSTYSVVLYKGKAFANSSTSRPIDISGSITEMAAGSYIITGDCTITIS